MTDHLSPLRARAVAPSHASVVLGIISRNEIGTRLARAILASLVRDERLF